MAPRDDDHPPDSRTPLLVRIDHPGTPGFRTAADDLVAGGLFIATDRPLPVGAQVPLLVSYPGLQAPMEVHVEVAWARSAEPEVPAGVAVRVPPERGADRLELARLARSANGPGEAERVLRILVVEDNELIVAMYEASLRKLPGADPRLQVAVEHARDGVEALARLGRSPRIELVVADLYMPVMDGFTLLERMRGDPSLLQLPVLAVSAGGDDARSRAVELGADAYLTKPVKMAELHAACRALLRLPPRG